LHLTKWQAPFVPDAKEVTFERGFVSSLFTSSQTFLQQAERWFAITPLTRVKFHTCMVWDTDVGYFAPRAEFLTSPLLGRLEVIDLSSTQITAASIEQFAECPDLSRLRELVLSWNQLQTDGAAALARMQQLKNLESLDLVSNGISDTGARAIAESPHLTRLKELRITRNPIRKKTWSALEMRFGTALVG
jgi:Leucine-rich repeat (LRR) protein